MTGIVMHSVILALLCASQQGPVALSPPPKQVAWDDKEVFRLVNGTPVVMADDATENELALLDALFKAVGFTLPVLKASKYHGGDPVIIIGELGRNTAIKQGKTKRFMAVKEDAPLPAQGYRLIIERKRIVLTGTDPAGTANGLRALTQIARNGIELPGVRIEDYPDLAWRGAVFSGPPSEEAWTALMRGGANILLFEDPAFCGLKADEAAQWRKIFDRARAAGIEPVPVIDPLAGAERLIEHFPRAAEGRTAVERVSLTGDDWSKLTKRNVLTGPGCPLRVEWNGALCQERDDYLIEPGDFAFPFEGTATPWLIRRVPGGVIPDGAAVTVTYGYVPAKTRTCCPNAEETQAALRKAMTTLVDALHPSRVHIGFGEAARLNQCPRCRAKGVGAAGCFSALVKASFTAAQTMDPPLDVMMWADAFNPSQLGASYGLTEAAGQLPKRLLVAARISGAGSTGVKAIQDTVSWANTNGLTLLGVAGPSIPNVCAWADALRGAGHPENGLLYQAGQTPEGLALALEKAWSGGGETSIWASGLNAYLDANLWRPTYGDAFKAMLRYIDRGTLAGQSPEAQYEAFDARLKAIVKASGGQEDEIHLADSIFRDVTTYLKLESAFVKDRDASLLSEVVALVKAQGAIDPKLDAERQGRIIEIMQGKDLFVPSTILFGEQILPFRSVQIPAGQTVYEIVGTPAYTDAEHKVTALYDLFAAPGALFRVDFETVGAARFAVESSSDGKAFKMAQEWTSTQRGGLMGPVIIEKPFRARHLRLVVEAPAEQAVLRNPRLFAYKSAPALTCAQLAKGDARVDAPLSTVAWPEKGIADGFVREGEYVFAEAQTVARVSRSRDVLLIGVSAYEPRLRTMVAEQTERDAPVWEEESIEVLVSTGIGGAFCFGVNARGTQYDSRGGDPGWDGNWQTSVRVRDDCWEAMVAIPFSMFGKTPARGDAWKIDIVRNRCNVRKERSHWAPSAEGLAGGLSFE